METLRWAAEVAAGSNSPHATLTDTYAHLLCFSPRFDPSTGAIRLERSAHRKESGTFYTPPAIADMLTEATLEPLRVGCSNGQELPSVLDPAMGTGVFFCHVVRYLARLTGHAAAEIAERCLHGVDLDPVAIEVAVLGLWLETGARPHVLAKRFHRADALTWASTGCMFDAVLSNPPWGAAWDESHRTGPRLKLPEPRGRAYDSFELFLALGAGLARCALGMLVPQAVLGQSTYAGVRGVLLQRLDPYSAFDFGDGQFPGVAAPVCGLVWGPKPGPDQIRCVAARRAEGTRRTTPERTRWTADGGFPFAPSGMLDLLERLQARHPVLGDLTGAFHVRDAGINYNRASLARRVLYETPVPDDPRDIPRYRGRNFARYTSIRAGGWLRHDACSMVQAEEKLSVDLALYARARKVVFRQTADRIVATLDTTRMAFGRSVIAITATDDETLLPLLACLNSSLITMLYRTLSGEDGRVLPQVKVGRVLALPVPFPGSSAVSASTRAQAREWAALEESVLVRVAGNDPHLAWAYLAELAFRHLDGEGHDASLDHRIDTVVGALYGVDRSEMDRLQSETTRNG